jgi:hypothetical protein
MSSKITQFVEMSDQQRKRRQRKRNRGKEEVDEPSRKRVKKVCFPYIVFFSFPEFRNQNPFMKFG